MFTLFSFSENITWKNYLIIFEHVNKLSRKNVGLENTRTKNLDYNYYSLWYWIWISIVIYVTELELENT